MIKMEVSTMKNSRLYSFLALIIGVSLAVTSGCTKVVTPDQTPAVPAVPPAQGVITAPVTAPVTGAADLVITKVWLDGSMINYTIKNIGTADSPQTYAYIYVNDILPAQGGSSFVDVLRPGQERLLAFSNYTWTLGKIFGGATVQVRVNPAGYIELPMDNSKVKVCADGKNEASEAIETNNCKVMLFGILWDYDLLRVANLAVWRNSNGVLPEPGSENEVNGAHFQVANADMEVTPQLETIPQQVPQGWMQGTWGYFYSDEYGSPRTTAIKIPAKLHFVARVGLARNATGSDGVTFKVGLKDLNDTVTWISDKTVTTPGAFEDWDINLSGYEGQKYYLILRVDAGASPVNDFAIWNQAKLLQVND
jgi:hypothetical protein